ncbi:MAG TPA: V-type ATP synthase subunit D, partial [Pedococcus sp.]|nr:V-type ATP synthase subunit D [Pedococcus sp.]
MPALSGIPPGRAGRNWLRRRLATAERGREQLDRKLRILFPEEQRLRILATRARADWESACAQADAWLLRAALLGGQDAIRCASRFEPVGVEVQWATTMGLT